MGLTRFRVFSLAVHEDHLALFAPGGVATHHAPLPPAEPLEVGSVHVDVPPVAERDSLQAGRGFRRLGTIVAAHPAGTYLLHPARCVRVRF